MIRNGDVMLMSWCHLGPMPFLCTEVWPTAICHICHGAISSRSFSEVFPSWRTSIDPETCSFDPSKTKFPEAINLQTIENIPGCTSFLCKPCQLCRKKTCRCLTRECTRECSAQTQPTMWELGRNARRLIFCTSALGTSASSAVTDEGLWTSNESTIEWIPASPVTSQKNVSLGFSNSGWGMGSRAIFTLSTWVARRPNWLQTIRSGSDVRWDSDLRLVRSDKNCNVFRLGDQMDLLCLTKAGKPGHALQLPARHVSLPRTHQKTLRSTGEFNPLGLGVAIPDIIFCPHSKSRKNIDLLTNIHQYQTRGLNKSIEMRSILAHKKWIYVPPSMKWLFRWIDNQMQSQQRLLCISLYQNIVLFL